MPKETPTLKPGKAGGKREQNRAERMKHLRDAGVALFLQRGVESVSIADLTEAAGTAKGNFYRYFEDKGDLVGAILDPVANQLRGAFAQCGDSLTKADGPDEVSQAYLLLGVSIASALMEEPDACRLYLQEHRSAPSDALAPVRTLAKEVRDSAIQLSQLAMDHGAVSMRDPQVGALSVIGATETLALEWLKDELDLEPQAAVRELVALVLDGIRGR